MKDIVTCTDVLAFEKWSAVSFDVKSISPVFMESFYLSVYRLLAMEYVLHVFTGTLMSFVGTVINIAIKQEGTHENRHPMSEHRSESALERICAVVNIPFPSPILLLESFLEES